MANKGALQRLKKVVDSETNRKEKIGEFSWYFDFSEGFAGISELAELTVKAHLEILWSKVKESRPLYGQKKFQSRE